MNVSAHRQITSKKVQNRNSRVFARVQGLLGPEQVVTVVPQGGRTPAERVHHVAWGEPREPEPGRSLDSAWPGAVPGPAPSKACLASPPPATLLDEHGRAVTVTSRGEATGARGAAVDALPGRGGEITAWAGPWPQDVRWWDRRGWTRRVHWQVVVGEVACLVRVERHHHRRRPLRLSVRTEAPQLAATRAIELHDLVGQGAALVGDDALGDGLDPVQPHVALVAGCWSSGTEGPRDARALREVEPALVHGVDSARRRRSRAARARRSCRASPR